MTWVTPLARVKGAADRAEPRLVGPELSAAPRASACPACGAALRPDALWCSLCYQDLRPAPVRPEPAAPPATVPTYGGMDPLTAPLMDLVLPPVPAQPTAPEQTVPQPTVPQQTAPAPAPESPSTAAVWPCTRCETQNPLTASVCTTCGAPFLAAASEPLSLVVPGFGDLGRFTRGQRVGLACAVLATVLVPFAVFTFVLTPKPDKPAEQTSTPVTSTQVTPTGAPVAP